MRKGHKYKITFDIRADEDRKCIVCVSAPNAGWIRYFPDTSIDLTTEWKTFEFEFDMTEKDDNNGRLEYNMGKHGDLHKEATFQNDKGTILLTLLNTYSPTVTVRYSTERRE